MCNGPTFGPMASFPTDLPLIPWNQSGSRPLREKSSSTPIVCTALILARGRQSALGAGPSSHATMAFAAFLAGIKRVLTVRYHWLTDGDLGNFDVDL